jgi:hypothetical protein
MAMYIGGIDPLKLDEGILNILIQKNIISRQEAEEIVNRAKAPPL